MPTLPAEVILMVVEALIPPNSLKIHRPDDAVTKTLISLTLVCNLTYHTARRLLFQHCLYLDSISRLSSLLDHSGYFKHKDTETEARRLEAYSLFLAPKPVFEPILGTRNVYQFDRLFTRICSSLQVLVVDLPLLSLSTSDGAIGIPEDSLEAFRRLKILERFCDGWDELFVRYTATDDTEPELWMWPRLRRLALLGPKPSRESAKELWRTPDLTHLVLMQPFPPMNKTISDSLAGGLPFGLKRIVVVDNREVSFLNARFIGEPSVGNSSLRGQLVVSQYSEDVSKDKMQPFSEGAVSLNTQLKDDVDINQKGLLEQAAEGTLWEPRSV
jgi:hypothetical protein